MKSMNASNARFSCVRSNPQNDLNSPDVSAASEKIFESSPRLVERVAFHIEKHVAVSRLRHQTETLRERVRDDLIDWALRPAPHLHRSLEPQLRERFGIHALGSLFFLCSREIDDRVDPARIEAPDLVAPHPCDQTQVVVRLARRGAGIRPFADLAMIAFFRIPAGRCLIRTLRQEALFDVAVVRRVIVDAETLLLAAAENDVAILWHRTRSAREMLAVIAELNQKVRLGAQGQLRIDYFVTPRPTRARCFDASQKVRVPQKLTIEKRRLVDQGIAAFHRGDGCHLRGFDPGEAVLGPFENRYAVREPFAQDVQGTVVRARRPCAQ